MYCIHCICYCTIQKLKRTGEEGEVATLDVTGAFLLQAPMDFEVIYVIMEKDIAEMLVIVPPGS